METIPGPNPVASFGDQDGKNDFVSQNHGECLSYKELADLTLSEYL
jgi:hypothetical protein